MCAKFVHNFACRFTAEQTKVIKDTMARYRCNESDAIRYMIGSWTDPNANTANEERALDPTPTVEAEASLGLE